MERSDLRQSGRVYVPEGKSKGSGGLYGQAFAGLKDQTPASVFLAEGSPIKVFSKKIIA